MVCRVSDVRVLAGVSKYSVNLEKQEVLVEGTIPYDTLLEKIKKTGKEVRSWARRRHRSS